MGNCSKCGKIHDNKQSVSNSHEKNSHGARVATRRGGLLRQATAILIEYSGLGSGWHVCFVASHAHTLSGTRIVAQPVGEDHGAEGLWEQAQRDKKREEKGGPGFA